MLESNTLRFGSSPDQAPLTFRTGTVTVFVGPNNSGKSRALMELVSAFDSERSRGGIMSQLSLRLPWVILKKLELRLPQQPDIRKELLSQLKSQLATRTLSQPEGPRSTWDQSLVSGQLLSLIETRTVVPKRLFPLIGETSPELLSALGDIHGRPPSPSEEDEDEEDGPALFEILQRWQQHEQANGPLREKLMGALTRFGEFITQYGEEEALSRLIAGGGVRLEPQAARYASLVLLLNGHIRLNLVQPQRSPDLRRKSNNLFANLMRAPKDLERLRRVVYEAFKLHLTVDITQPGGSRLVLSKDPGAHHERSTLPDALAYFDAAQDLATTTSDGVKAFVGLMCAALSDHYELILIDEPEAFLHPPLAHKLGRELHLLAQERKASVVVATHSPSFLMGCLQAGTDVNIVRLTYANGQGTARSLSAEQVQQFARNPLLRSSEVMDALFHDGAVVVEGDADRAFYREIHERLLARNEGSGGTLFLNAHGKQAIPHLLAPLRRMGIPVATIIDLDAIFDSSVLRTLLKEIDAQPIAVKAITAAKAEALLILKEVAKKRNTALSADAQLKEAIATMLKREGLGALPPKERGSIESTLLKPLEDHGIFLVPVGDLECWLPHLSKGVRKKGSWLPAIFDAMGSNPQDDKYAHPDVGDVWDFVRKVTTWLQKPILGMPT